MQQRQLHSKLSNHSAPAPRQRRPRCGQSRRCGVNCTRSGLILMWIESDPHLAHPASYAHAHAHSNWQCANPTISRASLCLGFSPKSALRGSGCAYMRPAPRFGNHPGRGGVRGVPPKTHNLRFRLVCGGLGPFRCRRGPARPPRGRVRGGARW